MTASAERPTRRTDALSRERIVAAAVELLDEGGERALTFRALARRLSTGAGAIYWHVADKDDLLSAATNAVVARTLAGVASRDQPRQEIRAISLDLFDTFEAHPWIGHQLARETWRAATLRIFDALGRRLAALEVPAESQFDVASALTSYVAGAAGQNAANARSAPRGMDRATFLARVADQGAGLDPGELPFVHRIVADLTSHDDRQQFLAGVDLILAGAAALRAPTASPG